MVQSMQKSSFEKGLECIHGFTGFWKVYQTNIDLDDPWEEFILSLNGKSWPVRSFIKCKTRVRGEQSCFELAKGVFLVAFSVRSKSPKLRNIFRIVVTKSFALIQNDQEGVSKRLFSELILPKFNLKESKEIRVNAMKIRKLIKIVTPTRLTLKVNFENAGVEGLESLILTGSNVIRGIQTLKDRQEVDLKADSIGTMVELESENLCFVIGKGLLLKQVDKKVWDILAKTLV